MYRLHFLLFILLFSIDQKGQVRSNPLADLYYNRGVQEFSINNYRLADSMFTRALAVHFEDKSSWFNRALCKLYMVDTINYCYDLSMAKNFGHTKAWELYYRDCEHTTSHKMDPGVPYPLNKYKTYSETINKTSSSITQRLYDDKKELRLIRYLTCCDTVYADSKDLTPAAYPGGNKKLRKALHKNVHYTPEAAALNKHESFVIFISVKIDRQGMFHMPTSENEVGDCAYLNLFRGLEQCEKWTPASIDGIPVNYERLIKYEFNKREKRRCIQGLCEHVKPTN